MDEFPRTLKLVTVWLLIILAVWMGVKWLQWHQGQTRFELDGSEIVLRRGPDGHFHWPGEVNGVAVDFLVDTGATSTALPARLAARAGLSLGAPVQSSTAGGTVMGHHSQADLRLRGGLAVQRLRVTVLPELDAPLLGMDVLGRLHFTQGNGVLRLSTTPR
jgi:aspartyl protease family protein